MSFGSILYFVSPPPSAGGSRLEAQIYIGGGGGVTQSQMFTVSISSDLEKEWEVLFLSKHSFASDGMSVLTTVRNS